MKCTICGEEVEKYTDETGHEVDPTMYVLLTKHDPKTDEVIGSIQDAAGHQECVEHRRIWRRLVALEKRVDAWGSPNGGAGKE